ncbi:MAG: alkaline phosphatase [Acidobacteria bacterium]|nr:MAG: alkaline phosphatase [Acidobacteriota bacterium]
MSARMRSDGKKSGFAEPSQGTICRAKQSRKLIHFRGTRQHTEEFRMDTLILGNARRSVPGFLLVLLILSSAAVQGADSQQPVRARNVVLIIGDAGGLSALHAGSLYHHNKPNGLFIQSLPHIALMDTSASDVWVTDSAAGVTALVTGQKTNNGVLSQANDAVRGKKDGTVLKTILEYAEERGLSTGVMTNVPVTDATAAGCYAHTNDRGNTAEIVKQFLAPRFGDGVDVLIGAGRQNVIMAADALDIDLKAELQKRGYGFFRKEEDVLASRGRVVGVFPTMDFDLPAQVQHAITTLSQNPRGYFLMVECDVHTDKLKLGLDHVAVLDRIVREVVERVGEDTLVIFGADHSFDIRVRGGKPGQPMLDGDQPAASGEPPKPFIRVDNGHSGEHVLVAAKGPGAERVRGFIANSDLFGIMMAAFGWAPAETKQEVSSR